jgi:hypothetical protein
MTLHIAAGIAFAITTLASALLAVIFRLSVKRDAPQLYESLWRPVMGGTMLRLEKIPFYAQMIYLRRYRATLADFPRPRAWASWLFAVNWLQLVALATLVLLTLDRAPC